ncbi:hypothetical protein [Microcoleus sp. F4-D5]|uniref:hypothetical protein n=1 Tax=Microcoleus sp. F4-D5 TaxID=2818760 RepID=UPI002FD466B3
MNVREELEILLPNRQNLGDYAARIREAIQTLESAEKSEVCPMPYALCPMPYALCTSGTSCY